MTESVEAAEAKEQATNLSIRAAKKLEKKARFIKEMNASSTLGKIFTWFKHKWFTSILFWSMLIFVGTFLIIAGRILWEIAKVIFSISL